MVDRKPPRLAAPERETLLALLQYQRESLVRKVDGVDEDAAAISPVPSGTTLAWLVDHLARAEASWIELRFAGREPSDELELGGPRLAAAVERYRGQWSRTDEVVWSNELDAVCANDDAEPTVSLRWILVHLLEETARHAGHADILRELLDGATGR
ncbi:MAG TPA: DinB family protein [Acidimicrobiales bacterium]|jgi:hypothetical protein